MWWKSQVPVGVSSSLTNLSLLAGDLGEAEAGVPPVQLNSCPAHSIALPDTYCILCRLHIGLQSFSYCEFGATASAIQCSLYKQ